MLRRFFITGVMGPCALALALGLAGIFTAPISDARANEFGDRSKAFVNALADEAVATLTKTDITPEQREERFRKLLVDNFDVPAIGRWVMGRYWRRATEAERVRYLDLFEDFIVVTYAKRFSDYTSEKLEVTRAITQNATDAIVRSELRGAKNQPPIRIDWRLRANNESLRVVDLVIEGVSMSQTQRSEFSSVIKRNGGNIEGLIDALRAKTAELSDNGVKAAATKK